MELKNSEMLIEVDEQTGATSGIYALNDAYKMNWVLENSDWGLIEGFRTESVTKEGNIITVAAVHKSMMLSVKIEKKMTDEGYFETYHMTNCGHAEFFMTKEKIGIPVPYACNYSDMSKVINESCVNHVWCGGDSAWLYSVKANGEKPYLVMTTLEGAIDDYSIKYDISRTLNGSYYRGAIILLPREQVLAPNETVIYRFLYRFCDERPEFAPMKNEGEIRFSADKYTVVKNEEVTFTLECAEEVDTVSICLGDEELPVYEEDGTIKCRVSFVTLGEKEVIAKVNGKKTRAFVKVSEPVSEILEKRAHFIAEKQQYHCAGSPIDGAYLIYDNETKTCYYEAGDNDHNACRERVGLGVVVCKALQEEYDECLMESLRKHRAFIEREIYDEKTATVYGDVGRRSDIVRIFNYPWLSTYYLEWYCLTKEKKCLENAARIILHFLELANMTNPAQCIEAVRIYKALKEEGIDELAEEFYEKFLTYVQNLDGSSGISSPVGYVECSWCSEIPASILCYCAQAYVLSGDTKYLEQAKAYDKMSQAFFAYQPDYHVNCIPVRYWDNFWFGKYACYGDVFPQYWSALTGWAYAWYDKARNTQEHASVIERNLSGNLCVYNEDGSAYNNYLYPYKVELYSSVPGAEKKYLKPQKDYGKRYDAWSNDQDWALYYASQFLM